METRKGPYKDHSPSKRGLHGFPCWFGGGYTGLKLGAYSEIMERDINIDMTIQR